MVKVESIAKEENSQPVADETKNVEVSVKEESRDIIEVEEEVEVPRVEASYEEDFNDSLGGGGIEQSSKLNIKKGNEAGGITNNSEVKKGEEVSKIEQDQDKSIISNTS